MMNEVEFKKFLENEVLAGVNRAVTERYLTPYLAIVRFSNDRRWQSSNFDLSMQANPAGLSPIATLSFDVNGSCFGGTGDNGIMGDIVPNIVHFNVSGRFEAKAEIVQSGARKVLSVTNEVISGLNKQRSVLIPTLYNDPLKSVVEASVDNLADWIGDKIALRGRQELAGI